MTRILITHGYSRQNKGDDAIVSAMAHTIKGILPDPKFTIMSVYSDHDRRYPEGKFFDADQFDCELVSALFPSPRMRLGSRPEFGPLLSVLTFVLFLVRYLLLLGVACILPKAGYLLLGSSGRRSWRSLLEADIVAVKGGGFLYSHGGREELSLVMALNPILLAGCLGKRIVLFPQSIGPFTSRLGRSLAARVLNRAHVLMVREERSEKEVRALGLTRPEIVLVPDSAFSLAPAEASLGKRLLRDAGVSADVFEKGTLVGFTVRPWQFQGHIGSPAELQGRFILNMAAMVRKVVVEHGAIAVLIPQVSGPADGENDLTVTAQLYELVRDLGNSVVHLQGDFSPLELKAMYGQMDLFVGTRMHSCIFALSEGVPTIAIAYLRNKAFGIMEMINLPELVIDIKDVAEGQHMHLLDAVWTRRSEVKNHLRDRMHMLREWIMAATIRAVRP